MKKQVVYMMFHISIIFVSNILTDATESTPVDIISEIMLLKDQIQKRDNFYGEKLAEMKDRLQKAEENSKSVEKHFKKKLIEAENRFYKAEERRNSAEKFFEKKISELEKKLYETTERGHKANDMIDDGKLPEIIDTLYAAEENIHEKEIAEREVNSGMEPTTKQAKDNHTEADVAEFLTAGRVSHKMPMAHGKINGKRLLTAPGSHRVAFSSHLSAKATELGKEHPIPFDQVLLNEGQAFDTVLHAFICPVDGIYMFQSSLLCDYGAHIETEIVKDGSVLARIYAAGDNGLPHGWDQGFNSATVQCNKGERVWVRVRLHNGNTVYPEQFSTFSGFLIWEI
ncbi:uncharacterized protein LOC128549925 [Mercenaria mercenaria]|uniref:uncharacterized protein LOC128549925 n=1 Tax=Mercenaria mercenaria TaxID=6596 RepID=UPI00234F0BC7|nr:uncharacterized protein LOC128549925 [Mercenaria mercenaria]